MRGLLALGLSFNSRCSCCTCFSGVQGPETTYHLFYSGQFAQVWNYFIGRLGIEYRDNNLRTLILNCWKQKGENPMANYMHKIMTPIIIWGLWRSRCSSRFDLEKPSFHRSKDMITFNITQIIKSRFKKINFENNWEDVCHMYEA